MTFLNEKSAFPTSVKHGETRTTYDSGNPTNSYFPQASTSREIPDIQIAAVHTGRKSSMLTGIAFIPGIPLLIEIDVTYY